MPEAETLTPVGAGLRLHLGQHLADLAAIESPVHWNVEDAFFPRTTTAAMITAAIRATIRPYSTAVAPRSLLTLRRVVTHVLAKRTIVRRFDMLLTSLPPKLGGSPSRTHIV